MIEEEENIQHKDVFHPTCEGPAPRPIAPRVCACGCENTFQPSRKDQIYLNTQHANFGYNHGKRKEKNKARTKEEAILARNDEILHKHFISERGNDVVVRYFDVLKADKFKFAYHIGRDEEGGHVKWYSYRYRYEILYTEPKQVKIYKR